ncbi:MAG: glycosyltransferase [Candidatus Thiodiazotropha sp. 6PLUC9]
MESTADSHDKNIALSFIIPTMNEEENIGRLIDSIHLHNKHIAHEVIVVDNGSTDRTRSIAEEKGATVLFEPELNIAGLRNAGATNSSGTIYIFLDGDVELTQEWSEEFPVTRKMLEEDRNIITGSKCSIANEENFLEKYWFSSSQGESGNYINSGHLIIHKQLFDNINGFNPDLVTGEDTDLSIRAKATQNARIINNQKLKVLHHGYPNDLYTFVKREAWHGTRTRKFFDVICCSNVQFATNIFLILHLSLIFTASMQLSLLSVVILISIVLLLLASALYKFGPKPKLVLSNSIIFYFYFLGRSISIFKVLFKL